VRTWLAARRTAGATEGALGKQGVADAHGDILGLDPELLGRDHGDRGAGAGADVLVARDDLDRPVAVDPHLGVRLVAGNDVPVAARHADAALLALLGGRCAAFPVAGRRVAGLLVAALPADRLRPEVELGEADRARFVLPLELEGIEAQLVGQLVDGRLDAERALRVAGRAKRGGRPGVREDLVLLGLEVRVLAVEAGGRTRRPGPGGDASRTVGEVVDGGDRAVPLRPHLDRHQGARGVARAELLLLPVEHHLDRRPGLLREAAGRGSESGAAGRGGRLAAEAAAHVVADDAHVLAVEAECLREARPHREDPLRRRVDGELVALPGSDDTVGLEARMGVDRAVVRPLVDDVGLREPLLDVPAPAAAAPPGRSGDVALDGGVRSRRALVEVVDEGGVFLHRRPQLVGEGPLLVDDLHQARGVHRHLG
jgi:hypothetical protein